MRWQIARNAKVKKLEERERQRADTLAKDIVNAFSVLQVVVLQ
jgi:hypothetical protein